MFVLSGWVFAQEITLESSSDWWVTPVLTIAPIVIIILIVKMGAIRKFFCGLYEKHAPNKDGKSWDGPPGSGNAA